MTTVAAALGPVSTALETDVRDYIRRHGIAVWLDVDGIYTSFVDRLAADARSGPLPYAVRAFRGSHLDLMLSLDGIAAGAEKPRVVIHLPGFNEEAVRQTPLLELYEAGARYRKALDSLVAEAAGTRVRPDEIARFLAEPGLSLERADAWLAAHLGREAGGLALHLQSLAPASLFDDLLTGGHVASRVGQPGTVDEICDRLTVWTGLPASWRETVLAAPVSRPDDVAVAGASWALGVEYARDLARPPVSPLLSFALALPRPVVETCRAIAAHLRNRHPDFYRRTADETEELLAGEIEATEARALGRVETFRFEEHAILWEALEALETGDWEFAASSAEPRVSVPTREDYFWLRDDPERQATWQLICDAARLGRAMACAGERLAATGGLEGALEAYTARGAAVDQAHRHLEQRRAALLYPSLPDFEVLRARLDALRSAWRRWADGWARDFNALCRTDGFLPPASHQQRTLFDDVVRPLTQEGGTTVLFLVDALRFEMAEELYQQVAGTAATSTHLKARLAELPTVTSVGMNVTAPVAANGRLVPALSANGGSILGFRTGEFRVLDPETRKRAMHDRVGGRACPWLTLDDVLDRDAVWLERSLKQAKLAIVHSQEIDNAGERGLGPVVFDQVLQKLRAAWRLLRDAGVRRFVLTGDHGFLLLDERTASAQSHGRRIDPKRRHVLSTVAADHTGEVRVPLTDLGYDGVDAHLMFPDSTAVFDTGRRGLTFVHGGNSLQERVVPVLTLVHRAAAGGHNLQYRIDATVRDAVAGMHCLDVRLEVAVQPALDFGSPREVELSIRVLDAGDVQVELCQARGAARIDGAALQATVGERFEVFFRLSGPVDSRVRIELHHPGAIDVLPHVPEARFPVMATRPVPATTPSGAPAGETQVSHAAWLQDLPEGGVRRIFEHLSTHGAVTEAEAAAMLGGARALRRFALDFDALVRRAPFGVRIDVVAGVKHYVKEGANR